MKATQRIPSATTARDRRQPGPTPPVVRRAPPVAARVLPHEATCACGGTCPRCKAAKKAREQEAARN